MSDDGKKTFFEDVDGELMRDVAYDAHDDEMVTVYEK
jgi:hypothetical protein